MGIGFDEDVVAAALDPANYPPGPLTRYAQALRQSANQAEYLSDGSQGTRDLVAGDVELLRDRADTAEAAAEDRRLCGSCDAGLPMSCTCPDVPEATS